MPDDTINAITQELAQLPGIAGVALGGSRARGVADDRSDMDIGLYYYPDCKPPFAAIREAAIRLDDAADPSGYGEYGEWGPWINGGVWLRIGGLKTDILLRDVDQVEAAVHDCVRGRPRIYYQPGHPHGFTNLIYAGEVRHNVALHDPDGVLARLRAATDPYPAALTQAVIGQFGWEAGFSLDAAAKAAQRGDLAYVTGCAFRAVACLVQVLFAVNGRFVVNEKGSLVELDGMAVVPPGFRTTTEAALSRLSTRPDDLIRTLSELAALHAMVMAVTDR